jgi:hypothetical protein
LIDIARIEAAETLFRREAADQIHGKEINVANINTQTRECQEYWNIQETGYGTFR